MLLLHTHAHTRIHHYIRISSVATIIETDVVLNVSIIFIGNNHQQNWHITLEFEDKNEFILSLYQIFSTEC